MEKKFDVVVVGAGPAGMFACLELTKLKPDLKIALIDMGKRVADRGEEEVMSGFGGAGTYSDGKLHFSPVLSHERVLHLITVPDYQELLNEIDEKFMSYGLEAVEYPRNKEEVAMLVEEAEKKGIELVVRRAKHAGTDNLKLIIQKIQDDLEEAGVTLVMETKIEDLVIEDGRAKGVIDDKGNKYLADKILMCPGRISTRWMQNLANKRGIKYQYDMVEVGVRVEFLQSVMRRYAEALYEIVFKVRTPTFDDIMRTFCTCPNGFVAVEKYEGYVCVNGHSYSSHDSKNSNFALVCEVNLTEPVENSIAYAESIARLASTIGGGKPILQRLADLRKNRRSSWSRLANSVVEPTLKDVTPGDISMALPHRIVVNILEGLEKLDEVMPGINDGSTLLYASEVKFRSSKVETGKDMQTTLPGVYVAGDAAGLSGSITGAAATGIMAARGIARAAS